MQKDLKKLFGEAHGLDEKSVDFLTKALEKIISWFDYIELQTVAWRADGNEYGRGDCV